MADKSGERNSRNKMEISPDSRSKTFYKLLAHKKKERWRELHKEPDKDPNHDTSILDSLSDLASENGWPEPRYKVQCTNAKEYFAYVDVGKHRSLSYPRGASDEIGAKIICAANAINELTTLSLLQEHQRVLTFDKNLIEERLSEIMETQKKGIGADKIENIYWRRYKEILPKNWLEIFTKSKEIPKNHRVILLPNKSFKETDFYKFIPTTNRNETNLIEVCHIKSATEIWVRYQMTAKELIYLNQFYEENKERTNAMREVKTGKYYAFFREEIWYRVLCVSQDSTTATIFLVDTGEEITVDINHLHFLIEKMHDFPAQAFRLGIYELLEWEEYEDIIPIIKKHLLRKNLYAAISQEFLADLKATFQLATFYDQNQQEINSTICTEFFGKLSKIRDLNEIKLHLPVFIKMFRRLSKNMLKGEDQAPLEINAKCFVRDVTDLWHRGILRKIVDEKQVEVFLVDYGSTVTTAVENVASIGALPKFVWGYPFQAVEEVPTN